MPLQDKDKPEALKLSLRELRRLYDHLNRNWHGLKNRTLGLIVGEVAVVSFLFSGDGIAVPTPSYGKVFFFSGIALISAAFGSLLWVLSTATWQIPFDISASRTLYKRFNDLIEFTEYIKEDYEGCIDHCLKKIATRARVYNISMILLSVGVIILLVLKFN